MHHHAWHDLHGMHHEEALVPTPPKGPPPRAHWDTKCDLHASHHRPVCTQLHARPKCETFIRIQPRMDACHACMPLHVHTRACVPVLQGSACCRYAYMHLRSCAEGAHVFPKRPRELSSLSASWSLHARSVLWRIRSHRRHQPQACCRKRCAQQRSSTTRRWARACMASAMSILSVTRCSRSLCRQENFAGWIMVRVALIHPLCIDWQGQPHATIPAQQPLQQQQQQQQPVQQEQPTLEQTRMRSLAGILGEDLSVRRSDCMKLHEVLCNAVATCERRQRVTPCMHTHTADLHSMVPLMDMFHSHASMIVHPLRPGKVVYARASEMEDCLICLHLLRARRSVCSATMQCTGCTTSMQHAC